MARPLNACITRLAPPTPTVASTRTGTISLAARAKYTADPPRVSTTLPKGPSRVSSATEPATRRGGVSSGTAAGTAARRDHVACMSKPLQEVLRRRVGVHLHPAASQLAGGVRVGAGCDDLPEVGGQACGGLIRGRVAPRVVGLDDVDPCSQLHHPFSAEVGKTAVERMRHVGEATHSVNHVHHLLRRQI